MIDNFALALTHGLLLLAGWRLIFRSDLDDDGALIPPATSRRDRWKRAGAKPEERPGA